MEEVFGGNILKLNLHQAACHLERQCRVRGHAGNEGELFIERGVQLVKSKVRGSATANVEYSLA